jgi:hypothetical protein
MDFPIAIIDGCGSWTLLDLARRLNARLIDAAQAR